jgi:hypothetical protein
MEKKKIPLFLGLLFLVSACGQDVSRSPLQVNPSINPIVVDPGPGQGGIPSSPYGDVLGRYTYSVIVNRALIGIGSDESENHYALLRTLPGPNSPGAYYGLGLGNQAQIGFGLRAAGLRVDAFQELSFKVIEPSGDHEDCESHMSLKLLVDLNCDSLNPDYRVITTSDFVPAKKDQWTPFAIKSEDPAFRFARTSGSARSLRSLLKNSPLACFVAGDVFDLGMKRDQKLAPFQLIYGDRFYFEPTSIRVDDIELQVQGETETEDFES